MEPQVPRGWYPDPAGAPCQRFWDGWQWTTLTDPPPGTVTTVTRNSTALVLFGWVVAILSLGYMLPWAVALTRSSPKTVSAGLVNLLLGWTIIGWIVALVLACG